MSGSSYSAEATVGAADSIRIPAVAAEHGQFRIGERLRLIAFAALVAGLVFRTVPILLDPTEPMDWCDGRAYHEIALSLATGRGFYISDPVVVADCAVVRLTLGPSHHYAPALPLIESAFIGALGNTNVALVLPLVLLSWVAVAVAWLTTRDLFGKDAALLVAAAVSLEWTSVVYGTARGYSENLVLISMTVTLWAILKGLFDDRFIVLAALFAGLGYLSKSSLGWFFLIAGVSGVAYRVLYRGRRILSNRWYWTGIAVFAIPVLAWSYRNISLFWDGTPLGLTDAWQTSALNSQMIADALRSPQQLVAGLVGKLPVMAFLAALPYLPLRAGWRPALTHWRDEAAFGLWMAIGLIFVLGWFFAAVFWVREQTSFLFADPLRYVMPACVPLLWLIVRYGHPSARAWSLTFAILAVMCFAPPDRLLQA